MKLMKIITKRLTQIGICSWLFATALLCCAGSTAFAQTPLKISYKLAKSQKVSLNIYDAKGQIVRELLHTAARTAGSKTEQWDGRDDAGKPAPAGSYTWKMLSVPGFGAEYITSPGASYPEGNYFSNRSPGTHAGPNTCLLYTSPSPRD